jgi:uncharacterized protein YndB with AHSA1/START domain
VIKKSEAPAMRSVEVEIEVPGTPEQVWQAVATGSGFSCWFVPTRIEEREGGAVSFEMVPGMESNGVVTRWDPPHTFVAEEKEWMPGGPPIATEIHVESRAGGTCVVRLVTNLFTSSADWDDQLESVEKGWPTFLNILRIYLAHFRGQRCAYTILMGQATASEAEGWAVLGKELGLGSATVGQRVELAGPGFPPIAGVVERVADYQVILRTERPGPGTVWLAVENCGAGAQPMLSVYLYGEGGPDLIARHAPAWRAWMDARFPAPVSAEGRLETA